ncbi:MAG: hypothetical protein KatS3mg017_0832 [Fimbriimonadales bacterium]|nr:MAG: hypothetical protein KatS3mg017_0832 [Fimbriimonadales bacterium]
MMHRTMAFGMASALLCASLAFAGDQRKSLPLQAYESSQIQSVSPKRMMKVRWENGRVVPLTPWIELGDFAPAGPCDPNEVLVFDHAGVDPATGNLGNSVCITGRFYLGPTYHNPYYANDIVSLVDAQYNGATASSLTHAWFWNPNLTNPASGSQQCYVIILTLEAFDAECQDVHEASGNVVDGVILDYGVMNAGGWLSAVCLNAIGGIQLPSQVADDGDPGTDLLGGWAVIYAQAIDTNSGAITLASGAQPFLWHNALSTNNAGDSTGTQFDDDNPTDGDHTSPDECYDYTYDLSSSGCPNPSILGGLMAFWVTSSCTASPDLDGNGCVDDADLLTVLFNFGSDGSAGGDANCDGIVDDADLLEVLFAFGSGC